MPKRNRAKKSRNNKGNRSVDPPYYHQYSYIATDADFTVPNNFTFSPAWQSFDGFENTSTLYQYFKPIKYRVKALGFGSTVADPPISFSFQPQNYIVDDGVTTPIYTPVTLLEMKGAVAYQAGARNIGKWISWPQGMIQLDMTLASTNTAGLLFVFGVDSDVLDGAYIVDILFKFYQRLPLSNITSTPGHFPIRHCQSVPGTISMQRQSTQVEETKENFLYVDAGARKAVNIVKKSPLQKYSHTSKEPNDFQITSLDTVSDDDIPL